MSKNRNTKEQQPVMANEFTDITNLVLKEYGGDTTSYFGTNDLFGDAQESTLIIGKKTYTYIAHGADDQLPYNYLEWASRNIVLSQSQGFNAKAAYGQGLRFVNREDHSDCTSEEIRNFCLYNSLSRVFLEQVTDVKNFDFYVAVIVLDRSREKIVSIRHRDACHCRFEKANASGRIEHIFYGDFRANHKPMKDEDRVEVLELLDEYNPLGDLLVRMGKMPGEDGKKKLRSDSYKFAILCKMPSPGQFYYPRPTWTSVFRDRWYDIYSLISTGKEHMIKNTSAPRIHIEMHRDYLDNVCYNEGLTDPLKIEQRKKREIENIKNFVTGIENAGKAMVSMFYIDPNGKENQMVRFKSIGSDSEQGGAWSGDGAEASNFLCYATGVHPNLVGAVPGKAQMNNSGSDKRELFTLKQALEKSYQDIMAIPYHVILHYNGWDKENTIDIPLIILTTLDQNTDAKRVTNENNNNDVEPNN